MVESRTLALARSLTQQVQTTCLVLVSGLQGLPTQLQQEALSLSHSASAAYLSRAPRLGQLPDGVLSVSRARLDQVLVSLDQVMDYMVNNTPLNWLVGPFYPRMVAMETPEVTPPSSASTPPISDLTPPPQEAGQEEVEPPSQEEEDPAPQTCQTEF